MAIVRAADMSSAEGAPESKSKTTAVILAVALAFWTWLYTYHANAGKFWAGLFLTMAGASLLIVFIGVPILVAVWLWAVIDTVSTESSWYKQYPKVHWSIAYRP